MPVLFFLALTGQAWALSCPGPAFPRGLPPTPCAPGCHLAPARSVCSACSVCVQRGQQRVVCCSLLQSATQKPRSSSGPRQCSPGQAPHRALGSPVDWPPQRPTSAGEGSSRRFTGAGLVAHARPAESRRPLKVERESALAAALCGFPFVCVCACACARARRRWLVSCRPARAPLSSTFHHLVSSIPARSAFADSHREILCTDLHREHRRRTEGNGRGQGQGPQGPS